MSESHRRADDCSFVRSVMSFCVDGVVKAHDAFSPSHWTNYSITFRIDYSPTAGSRVIRFSKASSERAVQRTHSEVENKNSPKHFKSSNKLKLVTYKLEHLFKNPFSMWKNCFEPTKLMWNLPTTHSPPCQKKTKTKEKILSHETHIIMRRENTISPKCFIALKHHANRTEQQ